MTLLPPPTGRPASDATVLTSRGVAALLGISISTAQLWMESEAMRLQALARAGLLDSGASVEFDRLTWLAARLTQAPIALITLLTPDQQWFKARHGLTFSDTPRAWAFCNHTIAQNDVFSVSDTLADARFCDNPLVTGPPHMRFYAGVPVTDADGFHLGALCVIDTEPRLLTQQQSRSLRELAAIACAEVVRTRQRMA